MVLRGLPKLIAVLTAAVLMAMAPTRSQAALSDDEALAIGVEAYLSIRW